MRILLILLVGLLASSLRAQTATPESGWWWNAAESGRGFSIEVQNHTLFFAGYLYDAAGNPLWYGASGSYNASTGSFSAPLLAFGQGQCMGCPYRAPTPRPSPGTLELRFSSPTTGTLTWPGGSVPITRFAFGIGADHRRLAGRWVFSSVVSSLSSSDWIHFDGTLTNNGTNFVTGTIQGGRIAVGALMDGSYGVLIDSSTSYYDLFMCPAPRAGLTQMTECRQWLYLKTGSPSGAGSPGMAFKYAAGAASIVSGSAASVDKALATGLPDALRRARAAVGAMD